MKSYYIEEFKDKDKYKSFIEYMLLHSEFFSLIYFRYIENEKPKKMVRVIDNSLKKFKIYSKRTQQWTNTETFDQIHINKFVLYHSDVKCLDSLMLLDDIFDWDYPYAPMDLCFYKEGYCWFAVTAHEYMAYLYTDDIEVLETLEGMGIELVYDGEETNLFRL